jgi:hypothetical protein
MAEKRTTPAGEPGTAVPKARAADPDPDRADRSPDRADQSAERAGPDRADTGRSGTAAAAGEGGAPPGASRASRAKAARSAGPATTPAGKPAGKAAKPSGKPATSAEPAVPAGAGGLEAASPAQAGGRPGPAAPGAWAAAVWEARDRPDQPLQAIAELAVAEIGPRAAVWVAWLRRTYPGAPDHGIARLAAYQAGRLGRVSALAAATRSGIVLRLPAWAWMAATLVLRTAAAYGHDPTDPRRATELLELLNRQPGRGHQGSDPTVALAARLGLRALLARLGPRRGAGAGLVRVATAAADNTDTIRRLAHRAARFYRAGNRSSTTVSSESISSRNSP